MSDVEGERRRGTLPTLGRSLRDGVRIDDRTRGDLCSAERIVHEICLPRARLVIGIRRVLPE
jgi:hypothetical protein